MRAIVRLTVIYVELNWKNMHVCKYRAETSVLE